MIFASDRMEDHVRLADYSRTRFDRGRSILAIALWRVVSGSLWHFPSSRLRGLLLRLFGADVKPGVIIQAGVKIRYPWRLVIGQDSWIGENSWLDNWVQISIGANTCISQCAHLCTGNHDWSDPEFAIKPKAIVIGDSAWVGARAVIGPGVTLETGAIAAIGSVVTRDVPAWEIHSGNPSCFLRVRRLRTTAGDRNREQTSTNCDRTTEFERVPGTHFEIS